MQIAGLLSESNPWNLLQMNELSSKNLVIVNESHVGNNMNAE